jgi:formylglycine-generating enzyme required for sulfatase activity
LVYVPGGTFTQEDTLGNSFTHTISAFEIGKYEVTYELWYTVRTWAESNGYIFANQGREGNDGTDGATPTSGNFEPVTFINWRDAMVWCNAYSEMDGRTPVYYSDSTYTTVLKMSSDSNLIDSSPGSYDNPYVDDTANGYRLPTEGQWQYAASYIDGTSWLPYNHASGDNSSYCYPNDGGTSTVFGDYAWYSGNSGSSTNDVGTKLANYLGIYDMSGNVWEWCWDWHGSYPSGHETDYKGAVSGSGRVFRGGSWSDGANCLRVGYRSSGSPYGGYSFIGFRVSFPSD